MNTIQNSGENDNSLNDGLDKLDQAYRQLPHEEPPQLLDQAILNSAHRAVEQKSHWMQFGWVHGLTTTAVFVLALSLIFNQREQAPVYEDGIKVIEPVGLQRERAVKKQSLDTQTDDLRMEMKEESEKRQDVFQSAPAGKASQNAAMEGLAVDVEALAGDQAIQAPAAARISASAVESPAVKTDRVDKDAASNEPVAEEMFADEADLVADAPEAESINQQSRPATLAVPVAREAEAPAYDESEAGQALLDIIKLKESGDETWVSELALFKQQYPDYPLPEDFSN